MYPEKIVAEVAASYVTYAESSHLETAGLVLPAAQSRRTLLWVDDSRTLLSLYKSVFESLGFEVLATSSPLAALDLLSAEAVDVAILDYDMPEMNGGALASMLKSRTPGLPIILYTGSTYIPCSAHDCVDAVCDKAAPREELLTMIERLARESEMRRLTACTGHLSAESATAQQA